MPALAASSIWKWLFDDRYGFVNWALVELGFAPLPGLRLVRRPQQRLRGDLRRRRLAVVPVHRAEPARRAADDPAATRSTPPRVDGADAVQRFRLVTLPLLRPILAVLVIFSTIWDFKIFDQVYVMAQGVPDRAADTAAVTAYREAFALGHFGTGAADRRRPLPACCWPSRSLYVRLIGKEGRDMRWLLRRGWLVRVRWWRSRRSRCFPIYYVVDHVAEAAQRDLHAHAGPVAQPPAVAPVPATCSARATSAARC